MPSAPRWILPSSTACLAGGSVWAAGRARRAGRRRRLLRPAGWLVRQGAPSAAACCLVAAALCGPCTLRPWLCIAPLPTMARSSDRQPAFTQQSPLHRLLAGRRLSSPAGLPPPCLRQVCILQPHRVHAPAAAAPRGALDKAFPRPAGPAASQVRTRLRRGGLAAEGEGAGAWQGAGAGQGPAREEQNRARSAGRRPAGSVLLPPRRCLRRRLCLSFCGTGLCLHLLHQPANSVDFTVSKCLIRVEYSGHAGCSLPPASISTSWCTAMPGMAACGSPVWTRLPASPQCPHWRQPSRPVVSKGGREGARGWGAWGRA